VAKQNQIEVGCTYDVLLQYNGPLHGIKRGNILKHPTYHVTQDTMVKYYGTYVHASKQEMIMVKFLLDLYNYSWNCWKIHTKKKNMY
jgi:hypothetical protein